MWHKPCRTFHLWCLCIKTRCLFLTSDEVGAAVKVTSRHSLWRLGGHRDSPNGQPCRGCCCLIFIGYCYIFMFYTYIPKIITQVLEAHQCPIHAGLPYRASVGPTGIGPRRSASDWSGIGSGALRLAHMGIKNKSNDNKNYTGCTSDVSPSWWWMVFALATNLPWQISPHEVHVRPLRAARIVVVPTLSSLVASQVVKMIASDAAGGGRVASWRLFVKYNTKAPCHWPLWGQSTGDLWLPLTKGQ